MKKSHYVIGDVMHPAPHTIGVGQSVEFAKKQMASLGVRHLPVLDGGRCVGIVSDRDIKLAYALENAKAGAMTLKDICSLDVYEVPPTEPLASVAQYMADAVIGSAIITEHGKVVGIFTTTDACKVLAKLA